MLTQRLGKQLTLIFCSIMTLQVKVSQGRRNIKSGLLAGNVIVTIFWDEKGIVFVNVLPRGAAVNSGCYA
jgi:hypothetical protein